MKTVVFDLDGTLADTSADLIRAANACFRDRGFDDALDPIADQSTAFRGGRAMLRLGVTRLALPSDVVEEAYPRFIEHYASALAVETKLYPGAAEAVAGLRDAGYLTTICTNKPAALAEDLMQDLGARGLFDVLIGADTLPVRKPDPAPYRAAVERAGGAVDDSVLIGDTETDFNTARAVGVPIVLVTFGPDGDGVRALGPDAVLPSYEALPGVVRGLIG